jgi:glycerol-3-phosphate acyltransferase PlsX
MRIALDAMGGDHAPHINVDGAIDALTKNLDLEVDLVGDQPVLDRLLQDSGYSGERLKIVPAEGFVGMDEKPTDALRKKPNSSIAVCWKQLANREVEAVVSAGNTGAVVAAGLRTRLFLKGVKRPGIAVELPTLKGRSILMDVGANPGARPEHLHQYGVIAAIYARQFLGIEKPRVGIMNIGSEDGKGNELVRETHRLFAEGFAHGEYIGNVEGRGLYQGEADVLVCEGFVGNVVLKVSEGMATALMTMIQQELYPALDVERDQAKGAIRSVSRRFEYHEVGGAPLLGVDGICLICHGSSDGRSIRNALQGAARLADRHINKLITEALAEVPV